MEQPAAFPPVRTSRRFRRKRAILAIFGLFVLFVVGLYFYQVRSADQRLQRAIEEASAADPNWRMIDLEAHRREVPDSENGMVQAMTALSLLPAPWPNWYSRPANETPEAQQAREALASSFADLDSPAQLSAAQTQALRGEWQRAAAAIHAARKMIDFPYGIQRLNWTRDYFSTLLPNTQKIRELANVLSYDIYLQVQDRDFAQAVRSARALLNTGRALGDEPTLISQLVRIAIDTLTYSRTERILAQGEPAPADLLALQRAIEQEAEEPLLYYGLRGERASFDGFLENVQTGEIPFKDLSNILMLTRSWGRGSSRGIEVQEKLEALAILLTIRSQRAEALDYMNQMVEVSRLPPEEQFPKLRDMESRNPQELPFIIRLLGSGSWKVGLASLRVRAQHRSTAVALAAERYRQVHGRWPASLGELLPAYLTAVPLDPFTGQPLKLARHDQGIVIYSVGPDGVDNGGVINAINPAAKGSDIGFRLWDVQFRRQAAKKGGEEP
jgi:hypothetical protein